LVAAVGLEPTTYGLPTNPQVSLKSRAFRFPQSAEMGILARSCYQVATKLGPQKAAFCNVGKSDNLMLDFITPIM